MSEKYLDIHIIYSDKDKKYLSTLLKGYKNFKIKNSVNNWKVSLKVHNNSGINNIGQFQRRLEIIRNTPSEHYIWFVDGDDEIINSADLKNKTTSRFREVIQLKIIIETFLQKNLL